jgi:hypothetical protein
MNNYKLIKLKEGYIIVSWEEQLIKENQYYLNYPTNNTVHQWKMGTGIHKGKSAWCKIVIASTFIPELQNIDFNNLGEDFGIFDVNKLASSEIPTNILQTSKGCFDDLNESERNVWKNGFNKCLELNKNKLYTEEQLRAELQSLAGEIATEDGELTACSPSLIYSWIESRIQSLQPKTEWDIEVEENILFFTKGNNSSRIILKGIIKV